jgi:NAD+ kinase
VPTVGLNANTTKPAAVEAAGRLAEFLENRGISVELQPQTAEALGRCAFVVVFGGDGTLLSAARLAAPFGTPLLGVHLGRFGFLTETSIESLLPAIESALENRCIVHERLMVQGVVQRASEENQTLYGMNDVVVASRAVRMVYVRTRIGAEELATYAADGVIVASPTGSTGYSLSAGGPLIHPASPVLVVTPIAPHTLSARALVIPDTETVYLTVEGESRDAVIVTVDGQIEVPLSAGDTVSVSKAPFSVKLLSTGGPGFYEKIRSRWHYAERLNR